MPTSDASQLTPLQQLQEARAVLRDEGDALQALAKRLDASFCQAVAAIADCPGSVIVTGIGKAGLIGQKIAATLSSTGTRSHFLHPAEAVHGNLGCLFAGDVLLALSNSGETEEVCRLLPTVKRMEIPIVAITATNRSTLGAHADVTIPLGRIEETGPYGLAPSTSTTAMLAVGDALALVVCQMKDFTPQHFAIYHPGGSLGRRLSLVGDIMRQGSELRVAAESSTVREVFANLARPGRRTGAVILTDDTGRLSGLFTDSDLARLLERRHESQLDGPISAVMTRNPVTVQPHARLQDVVEILSARKVSELPVVDGNHRPVGVIDITDVIGLLPTESAQALERAG